MDTEASNQMSGCGKTARIDFIHIHAIGIRIRADQADRP